MSSLIAFFDESRILDEEAGVPGVVAVAGYLGEAGMWQSSFSPAWQAVLASAHKPISEFKTSDCRQGVGEFTGWSRPNRDALTRDLVSVIADPAHNLIGFGAAVLMQDALFTSDVRQQNRRHFAYWWCTQSVLHDAINLAEAWPGAETLRAVYDEEKDLGPRLLETYPFFRDLVPGFADRVAAPEFGRSHQLAPLQAADLLAYETAKELRNRLEARAPSKALVRLVESNPHQGYWVPLPYLLTCLSLDEIGVEIPVSRGHRLYDSAADPQICRQSVTAGFTARRPNRRESMAALQRQLKEVRAGKLPS